MSRWLRRPWPADGDDTLRRLWPTANTIDDIAAEMNVSFPAVRAAAVRLRLPRRLKGRGRDGIVAMREGCTMGETFHDRRTADGPGLAGPDYHERTARPGSEELLRRLRACHTLNDVRETDRLR